MNPERVWDVVNKIEFPSIVMFSYYSLLACHPREYYSRAYHYYDTDWFPELECLSPSGSLASRRWSCKNKEKAYSIFPYHCVVKIIVLFNVIIWNKSRNRWSWNWSCWEWLLSIWAPGLLNDVGRLERNMYSKFLCFICSFNAVSANRMDLQGLLNI